MNPPWKRREKKYDRVGEIYVHVQYALCLMFSRRHFDMVMVVVNNVVKIVFVVVLNETW